MKITNKQSGITLIELMVVVAIMAIIGAVAVPAFISNTEESRIAECRNEVAAIRLAEEEFFIMNNVYIAGTLDGTAGPDLTLENNLAGIYTATNVARGPNTACTYLVGIGAGPPSYTVTATGVNALAGRGAVVNIVGP